MVPIMILKVWYGICLFLPLHNGLENDNGNSVWTSELKGD